MISVLVTNTKGGCGKTTVATHLAAAFAAAGLPTSLADVDRQRSSSEWLARRPESATLIEGLVWDKEIGRPSKSTARLVIDAPANMRLKEVDELIREADIVVIPVLPSIFDEGSTARFLAKIEQLKPIRKNRKGIAVIANRLRPRTRSAGRLETFLAGLGHPIVTRITDRTVYDDTAAQGMTLFDLPERRNAAAREEWAPLLRFIHQQG
jgi:chromosome partitioning protein